MYVNTWVMMMEVVNITIVITCNCYSYDIVATHTKHSYVFSCSVYIVHVRSKNSQCKHMYVHTLTKRTIKWITLCISHDFVLGLLLFKHCTTPLSLVINWRYLNHHLYADGTQVYIISLSTPGVNSSSQQRCICIYFTWWLSVDRWWMLITQSLLVYILLNQHVMLFQLGIYK